MYVPKLRADWEEEPLRPRTFPGDTPPWPVPLTMIGLLMLAVTMPMVAGQRGFGVTGETSPFKGYSGVRVREDATRVVYYHEQTIAVVEVGHKRELYNCELIEVYKPGELKATLHNLTEFAKPYRLHFQEMIELMKLCAQLNTPREGQRRSQSSGRALPNINPVSLLSGILPGTKWCGAGDLASSYHDLGAEEMLDKCCRAHDLCPVKVRAYTSRYNLTNNSLYTKSHCTCDSILQECLKAAHNPTADIMGNIYFNLLKVPCVRQSKERTTFQAADRY